MGHIPSVNDRIKGATICYAPMYVCPRGYSDRRASCWSAGRGMKRADWRTRAPARSPGIGSEAAYFTIVSDLTYEIRDLKIDVFGDVGVATYYPHVAYSRDGERFEGTGRQTFVFLRTAEGWKLVQEHGTPRNPPW